MYRIGTSSFYRCCNRLLFQKSSSHPSLKAQSSIHYLSSTSSSHDKHIPVVYDDLEESHALAKVADVLNNEPERLTEFALNLKGSTKRSLLLEIMRTQQIGPTRDEFRRLIAMEEVSTAYNRASFSDELKRADIDNDGHWSSEEMKIWMNSIVSEDTKMSGAEDDISSKPNRQQMWAVFIGQTIPFIGFGFMDNCIMILAGDQIDGTLGVAFGFSTMAAAGLGNLFSDVCGVGLGGVIEAASQKLGLPPVELSSEQRGHRYTRLATTFGQIFGIIIGCIVGLAPLFWIDPRERKLKTIFQAFDENGDGYIELDEITRSIENCGIDIPEDAFLALIHALDANADNKMDFQEFKKFMVTLESFVSNDKIKSNAKHSSFVKWIHDMID